MTIILGHLGRLATVLCMLAGPCVAAELRGHGGPVRAIAVTGDGGTAITGSFDTSAIIWSLDAGSAREVLRFHASQVNAVATLGDGRFATAGADARIAIWQEGRGAPVRVLDCHGAPIAALALSPDGATLASASWDGTVRLWPLAGEGAPRVLEGHQGNVNAVAFLPDGTLVSGGYDATLRVWPKAGGLPPKVTTLPSPINTLASLGNGELAVGGADGRVRILDRNGGLRVEATLAPSAIIALAVSPDGKHLAAGALQGPVAMVDTASLSARHSLAEPGLPVWSVAFSADGKAVLTGGTDGIVRSWSVETGKHIGPLAGSAPTPTLARYKGDPGAEVFRACAACHTLSPEDGNRAGPTLHGLFGRKIASAPNYAYSAALRDMDIVWTPETVSRLFEIGPSTYTPGTKMPEQRIGSPEKREALIRFLEKATRDEAAKP